VRLFRGLQIDRGANRATLLCLHSTVLQLSLHSTIWPKMVCRFGGPCACALCIVHVHMLARTGSWLWTRAIRRVIRPGSDDAQSQIRVQMLRTLRTTPGASGAEYFLNSTQLNSTQRRKPASKPSLPLLRSCAVVVVLGWNVERGTWNLELGTGNWELGKILPAAFRRRSAALAPHLPTVHYISLHHTYQSLPTFPLLFIVKYIHSVLGTWPKKERKMSRVSSLIYLRGCTNAVQSLLVADHSDFTRVRLVGLVGQGTYCISTSCKRGREGHPSRIHLRVQYCT
jgi:hypothetical protein